MDTKTDRKTDRQSLFEYFPHLYPLLIKNAGENDANLIRLHVLCAFVCFFAGINSVNIAHVKRKDLPLSKSGWWLQRHTNLVNIITSFSGRWTKSPRDGILELL